MVETSLITQPHDSYWDGSPTRRDLQNVIESFEHDLTIFRQELGILRVSVKFLLDKLGVSQAEMETYVARKKAELEKAQEAQIGSDKQLSKV